MHYLVVVSLELRGADSRGFECIYGRLKDIGLACSLMEPGGRERALPAATVAGTFEGSSARNIRNDICTKVGEAFDKCAVAGRAFISVGGDWDWGVRNVKQAAPYPDRPEAHPSRIPDSLP